jgi:hypothetical protein
MGQLSPANTRRWVVRRKAAVVAAVQSGKITLEEACQRTSLPRRSFAPGSAPMRRMAFPACAPPAFSNTAARARRDPADRAAADRHSIPLTNPPQRDWIGSSTSSAYNQSERDIIHTQDM